MEHFNYKVTWKVEHPPLGFVWQRVSNKMIMYLENVISSHIPYGHFGSGDLPIHVKIWSFLRKPFPGQSTNICWKYCNKKTCSKNVSASGEMIPTPYGSILHPPRASQVPYMPKIKFCFIYLFYYTVALSIPIGPFWMIVSTQKC